VREPAWIGRIVPIAVNYRGRFVPVWLGVAFTTTIALWVGITSLVSWATLGHLTRDRREIVWVAAGCVIVCAVGLYDDHRPARTRGLVRQLRLLVKGNVTSGIVKLATIVLAATVVAWAIGEREGRLLLAIPVIAGAANLWNLLDVRPGRALKYFLLADLALVIASRDTPGSFAAAVIVAAAAALAVDLREVAMLGDAGSNVLGFIVGVGLVDTLGTWGLGVVLAVILGLHLLAETVTLSRIIDASPPLRWFDRLGRLRDETEAA
jgi:UDP-N-acetylmuramyl pentapeptide phosphotransferase/UDP-N-acetylglucosamine-1-phosphate transferase